MHAVNFVSAVQEKYKTSSEIPPSPTGKVLLGRVNEFIHLEQDREEYDHLDRQDAKSMRNGTYPPCPSHFSYASARPVLHGSL